MLPVRVSEGLEIEHLSESDRPNKSVLIEGNFVKPPSNGGLGERSQTAQRYSDNQPKDDSTLSILQGEPLEDLSQHKKSPVPEIKMFKLA